MEKKTYGFAIIGCGVIANIHAAAIARVENAKLIGVYDFSLERTKEFADKYGCKAYAKQDELLEDPEISYFVLESHIRRTKKMPNRKSPIYIGLFSYKNGGKLLLCFVLGKVERRMICRL